MSDYSSWERKAKLLRVLSLESTTAAGSGHPTSCLSSTDLMTVLFDSYFSYDLDNPLNLNNDRLVFSKGHASPLFYSLYAIAGAFPLKSLETLRKFDSDLEGHPTPRFKYTDAATGSLGQGLSVGAGMAYVMKEQNDAKVYVLLGDGELAEGQIWEAANFASYYKLHNLIAIADINRLAQSQETMFGHHVKQYENRFRAFGFETVVIDGHNFKEIEGAFNDATSNKGGKPFIIIAKTDKGHGVSFLQDKDNWHGKALKKEELEKALSELGSVDRSLRFELKKPLPPETEGTSKPPNMISLNYEKDTEVATREVYGKELSELGKIDSAVMALDGDVKNSTFSQDFLKDHPRQFIECFIAEQNMVSVAVGLSRLGKKPFVSTFAAFLTRASDQIRMAALSDATICFTGSHVGVSIGEDGASQMGLEDISLFGTIPDSVVVQPSDAVSTAKLLRQLYLNKGISYMRTLRPKTPVLYEVDEDFSIGGSKILRHSTADVLTVVATGITVVEALKAQEQLDEEGIKVRVVDCYSIKPVDKNTLEKCLQETKLRTIITVEDHFIHGGLGDFALEALSQSNATIKKLGVDHISRSGTKDELLSDAKIDAAAIIAAIKALL